MANLLPKDSRKRLRSAQYTRLIVAVGLGILAAAIITLFALLPASITLSQIGSTAGSRIPALSGDDRAALEEIHEMIFALKPIAVATTTPTQALLRALSLKPLAVAIDHSTYTAGTPGTILLFGISPAPSAINAYRAALAADPHFSSVSVPVGALIGADNGRFTMTITGYF